MVVGVGDTVCQVAGALGGFIEWMTRGIIDQVPPLGELSLAGQGVVVLVSGDIFWLSSDLTLVSTAKEALTMSASL